MFLKIGTRVKLTSNHGPTFANQEGTIVALCTSYKKGYYVELDNEPSGYYGDKTFKFFHEEFNVIE